MLPILDSLQQKEKEIVKPIPPKKKGVLKPIKIMKIEIENSLNDIDEIANLMLIIDCAKSINCLLLLMEMINDNLPAKSFLQFGMGSSHIWVSYRNKRILLIK